MDVILEDIAMGAKLYPETRRVFLMDGRYIDSFLNECAAFPNAAHDDMVDTLVMAVDKYTNRQKKRRVLG